MYKYEKIERVQLGKLRMDCNFQFYYTDFISIMSFVMTRIMSSNLAFF